MVSTTDILAAYDSPFRRPVPAAALAGGVKYLQVDASADSEPILRRLGFRAITTKPFVWTPPGSDESSAP